MNTDSSRPDAAAAPRGAGTGGAFSLRTKGIIAFVVLATYVGASGYALRQQRIELLRLATALELRYTQETALAKANYATAHSVYKLQETFFSPKTSSSFAEEVALDVELLQSGLQGLLPYQPALAADVERLSKMVEELRRTPSRSALILLRDAERELAQRLDQETRKLREGREALWHEYRRLHEAMSALAVSLGLFGAVFFGAALTLFLSRLSLDIARLAARAKDVATGYRGAPLEVTRHDELGELMRAVNRMQAELREREQQLELSREQHFHKEKMMAIGSLAAAVAHEINNPIAAIAGIAESMKEAGQTGPDSVAFGRPELILDQTRRIATITRQIAELTTPHRVEPELLDLNALVRSTCQFIGFDKRFSKLKLVLDLDTQIPAITAVADHLTQILMNLLINAADALEFVSDREPVIRVATRATSDEMLLTVEDNGQGMNRAVLEHAFDESYTTKPPEKGRGLGLFLCKSLLERCGNRIELESSPEVGTTARIHLALQHQTGG